MSKVSNLYKTKKEESKTNTVHPTVYRPGQKPQWVDEDSDDNIFSEDEEEVIEKKKEKEIKKGDRNHKAENNVDNINNVAPKVDRRLIRHSEIITSSNKEGSKNEKIQPQSNKPRREIHKSKVIETNSTPITISRGEEIKRKLMEQEENNKKKEKENLDDELMELIGEDSENNSDDEKNKIPDDNNFSLQEEEEHFSEDPEEELLLRPVFVSKEERRTITEEQMRELEERELREQQERMKEIRKKQTKEIVKAYIEEDDNKPDKKETEDADDENMPDDTDVPDDLEEYEKWKVRELRRIKAQVEEDEKRVKEKMEIERRRNLTDEQRKEENLRLGSDDTLRPFKSKINFLQKYYSAGPYFMADAKEDVDHIYNRDYNLPTWEDRVDRSVLPKIMQKRRGMLFKKGQTKYTHLTAEDTTNFDKNYKVPDFIQSKLQTNLGGWKAQNDFDLGRKKKK